MKPSSFGTSWRRRTCGLTFWLVAALHGPVLAAPGLTDLLEQARRNDADYLAAQAARDAGLQARVIGRALLLPSASATYEMGSSDLERNYLNGAAPLDYAASTRTLNWRVSQPVFSLERWYSWREEDTRALLAEANFASAATELTLRLSRTLVDMLLAVDNLKLAQAQYQTLVSQRNDAENLRLAGVLTRTEVEDSRAKELSAQAAVLEADYALQMRRRELARIVGSQTALPDSGIAWQLPSPTPNVLEHWLDLVRQANPKVQAASLAVAIAEHSQARTRAAHLPTLDLIASATRTQNPNNFTALERSGGVSLRLSVPLYEGGRTEAQAVRAVALKQQALQELEVARRDAEIKAAEAFLGLGNASAKYRALSQALLASQTSLQGALIGRKVGLRTHTDVLNAQQQVFSVERDLARERYNHALAALQLKALAGQLSDADFAMLDPPQKAASP